MLVDTYELLEPVDAWLREELIPDLPAGSLVVIAGRRPLPSGWRADPGWRDLVRVVRLGNLDVDDAVRYLAGAGVPLDLRASTAAATRGHPLALALAVDVIGQRGGSGAAVLDDPDTLTALAGRLVDAVPDETQRSALAVCALARFTTEPLLRAVLDVGDARSLFDWLRGLSCMEAGPRGLYPHDLARDVLEADLRWRDERRHRELGGRLLGWIQQRIAEETGRARQEAIFDMFFSLRTDPLSRRYWNWETFGAVVGEPAQPADVDELLALVTAHEGPDSAAIAVRWLQSRPEAFTVYRTGSELSGFVTWLTFTEDDDEIRTDPVAVAAWRHARREGPLGPGEQIALQRFQIDRDSYQAPSAAVDLTALIHVELAVTRPRLAWVMMAIADAEFWAPFFATIGHYPGPVVAVGRRRYTLFARDARKPSQVSESLPPPPEPSAPAMSREEFAEHVRAALRDLGRVDRLAANPLVGLALVRERGGGPDGLRSILTEAAELLRGHPRDEKLFRAVDRTYLRPAPTQERAAELLDLPFSTYRRHRRDGVDRIVETLWTEERRTGPA